MLRRTSTGIDTITLWLNSLWWRRCAIPSLVFHPLGVSFTAVRCRSTGLPLLLLLLVFRTSSLPVPLLAESLGLEFVPITFDILQPARECQQR